MPSYIRIEDNSKATALEIIEVASVLYTGATNNNAECLIIPQRQDLPENGQPHPDEIPGEEEDSRRKRKPEKKPKKKGPSILDKWSNKLSSFFTGNEDDDDDIIE